MKRIAIIIAAIAIYGISASAQVRVVDIKRDADTLMFEFSSGIDMTRIFKNQYGYFIREDSDNMYDGYQRFYLGLNKEECITSINRFMQLFDEDVQTKARVIDAMGTEYIAVTDYGLGGTRRKKTKQKSNFVRLSSETMVGNIYLRKKSLEELIAILSKQ